MSLAPCHLWLRSGLLLALLLLSACASTPKHGTATDSAQADIVTGQGTVNTVHDPWEGWNRGVHHFNNAVDRAVTRPVARGYARTVPRPLRIGIGNVLSNLGQPTSALNSLLQGKPRQAGQSLARFALNLTLGLGGLFDPASEANLPRGNEDFGQTLAVWGWKQSRYLELPFFGPRTVRDSFGLGGDIAASPLRQIDDKPVRYGLSALSLINARAGLLSMDSLREGVPDDYTLVRDIWLQRRHALIFGNDPQSGQRLPDYLLDNDFADDPIPLPER